MTPLERAARKLRELTIKNGGVCRGDDETGWLEYIDDARAVLLAIREPSEAVLRAMRDTVPVSGHEWEYENDEAVAHWQSMIDAARDE